jgi:hypothetical protein
MKTIILLLFVVGVSFFANSCGSASAQNPQTSLTTPAPTGAALLSGQYTYWSEGQYWGGGQDGSLALPPGVPGYIPKVLYDAGTFDADGNGNATQCGGELGYLVYAAQLRYVDLSARRERQPRRQP